MGDNKINEMVRQLTDSAAARASKGNWQEAKKLCFQAQKVIAKGDDLQTLVPAIEKIRQGVRSVSHGLM